MLKLILAVALFTFGGAYRLAVSRSAGLGRPSAFSIGQGGALLSVRRPKFSAAVYDGQKPD